MFILIYNLFFPVVFLFFLPGLLVKLIRRPGKKDNYPERLALFSGEKRKRLEAMRGATWLHAVSVGETNLALTAIAAWRKKDPARKFVLSTTTTTAQEIAAKKVPENVEVIFAPIDFLPLVKKTYDIIRPSGLVIFETEFWPNLLHQAKKRGLPVVLCNGRISDRSFRGYRRFRMFFAPILREFTAICVQTETDRERLSEISSDLENRITVGGNIKFDQRAPENLKLPDLVSCFGPGKFLIVTAASTHSGEEKLLAETFVKLREKVPLMRLVIVPRHAERGAEIAEILRTNGIAFHRRTTGPAPEKPVECLLADTTGELMGFIASSDIVIMGKSLAGNDEGQNIIEPAVMGKAILCGMELKNFRQAMDILEKAGAIRKTTDQLLPENLLELASDETLRKSLGKKAFQAIARNSGAVAKNIELLEKYL